jgi:hypothetical protein
MVLKTIHTIIMFNLNFKFLSYKKRINLKDIFLFIFSILIKSPVKCIYAD